MVPLNVQGTDRREKMQSKREGGDLSDKRISKGSYKKLSRPYHSVPICSNSPNLPMALTSLSPTLHLKDGQRLGVPPVMEDEAQQCRLPGADLRHRLRHEEVDLQELRPVFCSLMAFWFQRQDSALQNTIAIAHCSPLPALISDHSRFKKCQTCDT
jgi:hypothetical protein